MDECIYVAYRIPVLSLPKSIQSECGGNDDAINIIKIIKITKNYERKSCTKGNLKMQ